MQKVPHIHIFGSNNSDWRKRSTNKSKTKLNDTWTSSHAWDEFHTHYKQRGYDSQLYYRTMRRSNSSNKLVQRPFGNDYYANAVRIFDNLRLRDIPGHGIDHLGSPYLVKGCRKRRQLKGGECVQCKEQSRIQQLRKQVNQSKTMINNNIRIQQQVKRQQYIQQPHTPMIMNSCVMVHPQQQQQVVNRITTVNAKPTVSFQYVANGSNDVRYPTFRVMEKEHMINQQQHQNYNNSYANNTNSTSIVSMNNNNTITNGVNKIITLGPIKRPQQVATITTISRKQSNHTLLPQLSGLINQLQMVGESGQSEKTKVMLDQLEQAAKKELLVRQKYIHRLDDLIEEYGKEIVQQKYERQQAVVTKTRSTFFC